MATREEDTPGLSLPEKELQEISDLVASVGRGEISAEDARQQVSGRARVLFERTLNALGPERRAKLAMQGDLDESPVTPEEGETAPPAPQKGGRRLTSEFDDLRDEPGQTDQTMSFRERRDQEAARRAREAVGQSDRRLTSEFDALRETPSGEETLAPSRFTTGRAFQEGFERGVTGPLRLFGLQAGEETPRHPVAGMVGEGTGMLATFLPYFKAGQMATRGVGILRGLSTEAAEQFARRTVTGQAMTGAISGGAFEAGFAETPGGALKRGAFGAAAGAVLDPAADRFFRGLFAGKAANARQAAQEAAERATAEGRVVGAVQRGEPLSVRRMGVPSAELAIERELSPRKLLDGDKLSYVTRQFMDRDSNLGQVIGQMGLAYNPHGLSIIPAVEGPEKVIPALRSLLPDETQFLTRRADDGTFEMLVAEPEMRDRLVAKVRASKKTEFTEKVERRMMGEGEPVLNSKQMLRLLREDFPESDIPDIPNTSGFAPEMQGTGIDVRVGSLDDFTEARWNRGRLGEYAVEDIESLDFIMQLRDDIPEAAHLATIIHEYTHHLTASTFVNRPIDALADATTELEGIWRAMGFPTEELPKIRSQMQEATARTVQRLQAEVLDEISMIDDLLERVRDPQSSISSDVELLAYTVELMFMDPKFARRVAPDAVERLGQYIEQQSPKMRVLLTKEKRNLDRILVKEWGPSKRVFAETPTVIDDAARKQFKEDGLFSGLEVYHQGEAWDWVGKTDRRTTPPGTNVSKRLHKIQHPLTGETKEVLRTDFVRPTLPRLMKRTQDAVNKVDEVLDGGLQGFVNMSLRDPETGNAVRAALNIENFARTDDLARWVAMNRPQAISGIRGRRPVSAEINEETARRVASELGFDGILVNDNGRYRAVVANDDAILTGEVAVKESAIDYVDGELGDTVFDLSFNNAMRGMLRRAGVPERELDYFMDIASERYGQRLKNVMDEEALRALETSARGASDVTDDLETAASRVNLEVERHNGTVRLVHAGNKKEVASGLSEQEAREYIARAGMATDEIETRPSQLIEENIGQSGGGGRPAKFQEQAANFDSGQLKDEGLISRIFGGMNILGTTFTAMENVASSFEHAGLGKPLTEIFTPTQRAIEKVNRFAAGVKRAALGNRTYDEVIQEVAARADAMPKEEQAKIVDYIEFMTKDELRQPGGLLRRGMTQEEIRLAQRIEELGHANDIARLMATGRLADNLLESKQAFRETVESLERREIGEELAQTVERIKRLADDTPPTRELIFDELGLTNAEREVIGIADMARDAPMDEVSIYAIGRYAGAPELPAGYESGRAYFADAMDMSEEQVQTAQLMERALQDAFGKTGLNPRRQIGGFWPHMRKLTEQGFTPGDDFIREALPESVDWSHAHIRTGELDVYSKDPADVLMRYVRSLGMKKHFDPLMPDVMDALDVVKAQDERAGRIMEEYVNELRGHTHSSFQKIEDAIRGMSQAIGFDPPEGIVETTTNILTTLAYGATIPFRPSLTARNYFQPFQMITPRVGPKAFWQGVARANSDEGFEMARRAGAVPENIDPVHAATEVDMNKITRGVSQRVDRLARKGFDWYRSADQWGRAVAYHAQRARIDKHIDAYMNGDMSFDEFLTKIKGKTYRAADQQKFADLIAEGNIEQAKDYLGRRLARETLMRYGHANHPAGWNSIYGRLFGQFGSWPVQYKDFLAQGLTQGTTKDIAEFVAWHSAINLGTVQVGAAVGLNLWNWLSFPSLQYTGGPYADIAQNLVTLTSGSDAEQSLAKRNLAFQFPTLEDPRSIFVPMSYSIGDVVRGLQSGGTEGVVQAFGFDLMQGRDVGPLQMARDAF